MINNSNENLEENLLIRNKFLISVPFDCNLMKNVLFRYHPPTTNVRFPVPKRGNVKKDSSNYC